VAWCEGSRIFAVVLSPPSPCVEEGIDSFPSFFPQDRSFPALVQARRLRNCLFRDLSSMFLIYTIILSFKGSPSFDVDSGDQFLNARLFIPLQAACANSFYSDDEHAVL